MSEISANQIQSLLSHVYSHSLALAKARALYAEQLAPDFSIFNYIAANETNLSYILADLLNPKGSHNQGDLFLRQFFEVVLADQDFVESWQGFQANLSQCQVQTEVLCSSSGTQRRMDIYLSAHDAEHSYGICIENKPYAKDQKNQLRDYYQELKRRKYSHCLIIYLCEYGEPSADSISKEKLKELIEQNEFIHLKYSDLTQWLNMCKMQCQNASVSEFIQQFIKFIQRQFIGVKDMNEQNEIMKTLLQSSENIESAIKISKSINKMKKELIEKLSQQLKDSIVSNPNYTLYENKLHIDSAKYSGFGVVLHQYAMCISFEFQKAEYNGLCMGYHPLNLKLKRGQVLFDETAKLLSEKLAHKNIKISDTWCGYYYMPNFTHWENDAELWSKIPSGEIADLIMNEINLLANIIRENQISLNIQS